MWIYNDQLIQSREDCPKDAIGILYQITHVPTGRWYIGRRMLSKIKISRSKGKKIKTKVDTDWMTYWSSSNIIKDLVKECGETEFIREILIFCKTKASLTLGEEYLLHVSGSLFDPNCLNGNIRAKIFRTWFVKTPTLFNDLKKIAKDKKLCD